MTAWGHLAFCNFYPRSPRGERPGNGRCTKDGGVISIHAPRVGSDPGFLSGWRCCQISIHAPRVGSDIDTARERDAALKISIHAPRVGSDVIAEQIDACDDVFLSTLPAWGATDVPRGHP